MRFHILIVALVLSGVLAACSQKEKEQPVAAASSEKSTEPESHVRRGTNGEVVVTLEAATQKLMGLQTSTLMAARLNPERKGYGRVVDTAPLATLVADLTTSQAAVVASQAELKRLKTLASQNNASERALQTAEAAAARDQAQFQSARLRLLAGWGSAIAERQSLPEFVQALSSLTNVLVEIDLPADESLGTVPTGARLVALTYSQPIEAQFISLAPVIDPQLQGRGYLFLVAPNTASLVPGAAVTGFISLPGELQSGVALPREAVVRHNGATWIYLQTSEEAFARIEVSLGRPMENAWFVQQGLKPGDKVVTVGAQELLSEELKGQAE